MNEVALSDKERLIAIQRLVLDGLRLADDLGPVYIDSEDEDGEPETEDNAFTKLFLEIEREIAELRAQLAERDERLAAIAELAWRAQQSALTAAVLQSDMRKIEVIAKGEQP